LAARKTPPTPSDSATFVLANECENGTPALTEKSSANAEVLQRSRLAAVKAVKIVFFHDIT